jgi:hypothetical protein
MAGVLRLGYFFVSFIRERADAFGAAVAFRAARATRFPRLLRSSFRGSPPRAPTSGPVETLVVCEEHAVMLAGSGEHERVWEPE